MVNETSDITPEETPKGRKKRLKAQAKEARPEKKPKVSGTRPVATPESPELQRIARKAKLDKTPTVTPKIEPEDLQEKPKAAKFKEVEEPGTNERNTDFAKQQKEKDVGEIGESTAKYVKDIEEIPFSDVTPKNPGTTSADPLRPKLTNPTPKFTPAQEAKRTGKLGTPVGAAGSGAYKFDAPGKPKKGAAKNTEVIAADRKTRGLDGLPGDEDGTNAVAIRLAHRDWEEARRTGKTINEIDPDSKEPTREHMGTEEGRYLYTGHHRRLATVMKTGGVKEEQIRSFGAHTGATMTTKTSLLYKLGKDYGSAKQHTVVDPKDEGVTHWEHPILKEPMLDKKGKQVIGEDGKPVSMPKLIPISDNHPDMPGYFHRAKGTEDRVHPDTETAYWLLDKKLHHPDHPELDDELGWDPEEPQGWNITKRSGGVGGINVYKLNRAPENTVSLWEHAITGIKDTIPQANASADSRLQHKAIASKYVVDLDAGPDADTRRTDLTKPGINKDSIVENKNALHTKTKRGKTRVQRVYKSTGRTVSRGYTMDKEGIATPTVVPMTSRARNHRDGMLSPTKQFGDSGYAEGGSTLITDTTSAPEFAAISSPAAAKQKKGRLNIKNSAGETRRADINNKGEAVIIPPGGRKARGVLVEKRSVLPASKDTKTKLETGPTVIPDPEDETKSKTVLGVVSKQFTTAMPDAPRPKWDTPNIIGNEEPGVSSAKPITKGKGTFSRVTVQDPKIAKHHPKTKKTVEKIVYTPGAVDQMLPTPAQMKTPDKLSVEHTYEKDSKGKDVWKGSKVVGSIGEPDEEDVNTLNKLKLESESRLRHYAHLDSLADKKEKTIVDLLSRPNRPNITLSSSRQLAKVPGNSPTVGEPTAPKPGPKARLHDNTKPKEGDTKPKEKEQHWAVTRGLTDSRELKPEQLAFPGMERVGSSHASGAQWLSPREQSSKTLNLQGKNRGAGVPGGSNPIQVERGTEQSKSTKSFKNKK